MIITPIKTHKITKNDKDIFKILDKYLPKLSENSIIAITSKIISISENRIIPKNEIFKKDLIKKEADFYIPAEKNKFDVALTIIDKTLIASAGIDLSNKKNYILWPKNPQKTANSIRKYLINKFKIKNFGIVITDSVSRPLRWGATGICIAWSGFKPFKNYKNPNALNRNSHFNKANIADGIAAVSVLIMGEGAEHTPIALIENLPFIEFQNHNPSLKEINEFKLEISSDVFALLFEKAPWQKGKGSYKK